MPDDQPNFEEILNINELVHSPARLAILMFLLPRLHATFPEIQHALSMTSGNLASHTKKLAKSGFIEVTKEFIDAKPTTIYTITPRGEEAIDEYRRVLRNILSVLEGNEKSI